MRVIGPMAVAVAALTVAATSPAGAAAMSERGEHLMTPSAVATWDLSKLHELGDDAPGAPLYEGLTVHELKGMGIVDVAGEKIVEIEGVLADETGRIVAVTVDVGGFLGIGGKEVIVGVDRLELRREKFATTMSTEELKRQPEWKR